MNKTLAKHRDIFCHFCFAKKVRQRAAREIRAPAQDRVRGKRMLGNWTTVTKLK